MGNKQNVWNSEKECFELVDVYEGVMAEYSRQEKAAQHRMHLTAFGARLAWLLFGFILLLAMVLVIIGGK